MGTVDVGKDANLVILDANPIASVRNLHRISGVVRGGVYYSRSDLDGIIRGAIQP
jgi:imidazolonepropionase-like amidohydrolase